MTDPYEILGLDSDADETAVRRRYLELVRQHPPEREPEQFAAIREAYEHLADPVKRMERQLFDVRPEDSLDSILADVRQRLQTERIPTAALLRLAE